MKTKNLVLVLSLGALTAVFPVSRAADSTPNADNSGNNTTDTQAKAVTPLSQSNADADIRVTRSIRRALVKDSSLSVYAHNIKIITTRDHVVYLRGAVSSSDDLGKIVALAGQNSQGYPVKNQLSVTNNNP